MRFADVSRADYESSEEKQLALERLFEIVGEAASKVSEDFKKTHPQLPWREATAILTIAPIEVPLLSNCLERTNSFFSSVKYL